jgi:hypothetical protein
MLNQQATIIASTLTSTPPVSSDVADASTMARADGNEALLKLYQTLIPTDVQRLVAGEPWSAEDVREEIIKSLAEIAQAKRPIKGVIGELLNGLEAMPGQLERFVHTVTRVEAGRDNTLVRCLLEEAPYRGVTDHQRSALCTLVLHAAKLKLLGPKDAAKAVPALCGKGRGPCNVAAAEAMVTELLELGTFLNVYTFSNVMDAYDSLDDVLRVLAQMVTLL